MEKQAGPLLLIDAAAIGEYLARAAMAGQVVLEAFNESWYWFEKMGANIGMRFKYLPRPVACVGADVEHNVM
ncbi:hypothetical protein GSbR_13190 [Geobacter sp. SVR]|nr:hypothetical protein GSVR_42640 [Geobacter sp. SVR]GCF84719.1 hypothetical protein GSbR_13190 [Geobacter sp. SVR]